MRTWNNPAVHQNDIETSKGNYKALFNRERRRANKTSSCRILVTCDKPSMSDFNTDIAKERKRDACYSIVKHVLTGKLTAGTTVPSNLNYH